MLEKSSKYPHERILNLFNILDDWLELPNTHIQLSAAPATHHNLTKYLAEQAQQLGASNPNILAEHIALIAYNAAIQKTKELDSNHLTHAKKATEALILAQTQKEKLQLSFTKPAIYGLAASCILALGIALFWRSIPNTSPPILTENNIDTDVTATFNQDNSKLTAKDAADMYAKFELMRNGTCQFPEALQIPDKHKAVYIESVVGGKLPADLADLAIANTYLEKVRCNYTPMLMANSK